MASRYRKKLIETNDCTVIATAICCRMPYEKAHKLLKKFGRGDRKGFCISPHLSAVKHAGFKVDKSNPVQPNGSKYTAITIGNKLKKGYYLLTSDGHAFALVNGSIENWVDGRRHRITAAYKITRPRIKSEPIERL